MSEELDEIKLLSQNQLASIVWPPRTPRENASYMNEFALHIRDRFNETTPQKYSREIQEFSNLRNIALSSLADNSFRDASSLRALKKYYCQTIAILNRFKDSAAVFPWKDAFGRGTNEGGLEFEINNIMYDIAALHNEFGAKISKTSEPATKEACLHFSNALWWVTELRENRGGLKPKEMGHDLLTFFHHILQAQAQECILLHSIRASMRPENVAKIAAQIANDYDIATKLAVTPLYTDPLRDIISGTSAFPTWRATVEFKHKYFMAITQFLSGLSNREDSAKEIGTRIARLKRASNLAEQCKKIVSDTFDPNATKAAFNALEGLIAKKLDKATRYNDNVYHASIPSNETLPQVESKLIVSAVPFSVASVPEFKDIFGSLVTIEAVQGNSIYSQKKDDMKRDINTQVSKQDEELAQMISTLNIDKRTLRMPTIETPDELLDMCSELSMNPNILDDYLTKLEEVEDRKEDIQNMLETLKSMLQRRPNRQFQEDLSRLLKRHEDACRSTESLHKQLRADLKKEIQRMASQDPSELLPKFEDSSDDMEVIKTLEILLDKVDEMKQQRSNLITQLRQSLDDDDVIKHVVAASSEHELKSVFDQEILKHNKFLAPLQANLKMQNDLLDSLERANAKYGQVKLNYRNKRLAYAERVESLKKVYTTFKTICEGIEEALKYHNSEVEFVRDFYKRVQASHDLNDLLN